MPSSTEWAFQNDLKADKSTLKSVIEFVNAYSKNPLKLLETHKGYQAVWFITSFSSKHANSLEKENIDDLNLKKCAKHYKILWEVFKNVADTRKAWIKKPTRPLRGLELEEKTSGEERQKFCFGILPLNFSCLLPLSKSLHLTLNKPESITVFLNVLNDDDFIRKIDESILDAVIGALAALSLYADANKTEWQKVVGVLLKFVKSRPKFETQVYLIVAKVASDTEIEELSFIDEMMEKFFHLLNEPSDSMKQKFVDEELKISVVLNVSACSDEGKLIPVTSILGSLYSLAVNDKIKLSLYHKLKDSLKAWVLINQNEVVRQYVVHLLAQLCFNGQVLDDLAQDQELCECIGQLSKDEAITWKKLRKSCQQISWHLEARSRRNELPSETRESYEFDFIISCHPAARELSAKIEKSLETNGFKVLASSEPGSLETMTKALDNSKCVLMFVNEKYRQSVNKRMEIEWAHRGNKKIISLIVQKNYGQVGGWMGSMMVKY